MGSDASKVCYSSLTRFYLPTVVCNSSDLSIDTNRSEDNKIIQKRSTETETTNDQSFSIENINNSFNNTYISQEKETNQSLSNIIFKYTINQNQPANSYSKTINEYEFSNKNGKLFDKTIIKPKNSETNTITIFDWDNTLFPTNFLIQKVHNPTCSLNFSEKEKNAIKELDNRIIKIINNAVDKGIVFIITNSEKGWVEKCCQLYYPELSRYMEKVNIISAKALYEKEFPNNAEMWKIKTFTELSKHPEIDNSLKTQIICFGDTDLEITSAKIFAKEFENHILKTVKFIENPGLFQLIKQIKLIELEFKKIYDFPKNISIFVGRKSNKNTLLI